MSETYQKPKNIQNVLDNERYNEKSIKELEQYVESQIKDNTFDIDANLALLKLYQLYPRSLNQQNLLKVLIKALSRLPTTDFQQCLYLIPHGLMSNESIKNMRILSQKLESANFTEFWQDLKKFNISEIKLIPNFEDQIRDFISDVFSITYQSVEKSLLISSLDLNEELFNKFLQNKNWKLEGESVSIPINESNNTRPEKTLRPITIKQFTNILSTTELFN
eukprot:TRINITY_DN4493_c0_g1_i1.p1 TRINITY_DN4493_c0_g1~~TRINITY_DN4493_c0_g1_i1.p1  ORF type:complete len:221 (-),score=58.17 TRINITY_DN4493_c0_g1_i1:36-698(-)